jgi:hypothetical protein
MDLGVEVEIAGTVEEQSRRRRRTPPDLAHRERATLKVRFGKDVSSTIPVTESVSIATNGAIMKRIITLDIPMFAFVVATRVALGVGVGLLVAERLPRGNRRTAGAVLLALGAFTTVPAAIAIRQSLRRRATRVRGIGSSGIQRDENLVGVERFPRKGDDDIL